MWVRWRFRSGTAREPFFFSENVGTVLGPKMRQIHSPGVEAIRGQKTFWTHTHNPVGPRFHDVKKTRDSGRSDVFSNQENECRIRSLLYS